MTRPTFDLVPYRLRLHGLFRTAGGTYSERAGILVRASDSDGGDGWGEAAPLPGFGGESLERCREALATLTGTLAAWVGAGEAALPATLSDLRALMERLGPLAADAPAARAGVDLALADLAARRAGVPLARWLAPDAASTVAVNGIVGAVTPEKAERRARLLAKDGYRAVKVKIGLDDVVDIERIAAVCAVVGRGVRVRADANGAWDPLRAEVMLEALAPQHLDYVEQPLTAADIEGLAALRRAGTTRIAADESLLEPDGVTRVLDTGAADVVVLKPGLLGGLAASWSIAARARAAGVDVVVGTALDAAVGRMGALHLAAALPGMTRACGLATSEVLAEDVGVAPRPEHGRLAVPETPGLGIAVDVPHAP